MKKMKNLIFLAIAIALMIAGNSCSGSASNKNEQAVSTQTEVSEKQGTLAVEGSCGMCKSRIEKTAKSIAGVHTANWNSETKTLTFDYDAAETSPEAVSAAIAKVGHDTDKDKAPDAVYDALPGCCQYRKG
jgi:Cu(I)/Ag(I) efflux system membrane fusion protein